MASLILYPSFGQIVEPIQSGYILPVEADIKSIKFINNIAYQITPTENLSKVYKSDVEYAGVIININDEVVTIKVATNGTMYTIRHYDMVKTVPDSYIIDYDQNDKNQIVSFLIKDASAESFYTFDLKQKLLQQAANLVVPFDFNGDVSIVAGNIKMDSPVQAQSFAMMAAPMARNRAINSESEVEDVSEYKHIIIGKHQLYKGNNIIIINKFNINYKQIYHHNLASTTGVNFSYTFVAPAFLANGLVTVYDGQVLIGKSNINEYQKDSISKIIMGQTTRVTAETKLNKEHKDRESTDYDVSFTSKLDNKTDNIITIKLEYYVDNGNVSNIKGLDGKIDKNNLVFTLELKPGKATVSASFHLKY